MYLYSDSEAATRILQFAQARGIELEIDSRLGRRDHKNTVPARYAFELLEHAVEQTGWEDFGIQYGQWVNLQGLETLSLMWQQAESISQWYRILQRYSHVETNAVRYGLKRRRDTAELIHEPSPMLRTKTDHVIQIMVVMSVRVFRELLGADWAPIRLDLAQSRPADLDGFENFFKCDIRFGAEQNVLVVRVGDFDKKLPSHNPEMMAFLGSYLQELERRSSLELEALIAQVIADELAVQTPSIDRVAEQIGTSTRSLQRNLRKRGTCFSTILKQVRMDILNTLSKGSVKPPLSKVAQELGFSDVTSVSRFLRHQAE